MAHFVVRSVICDPGADVNEDAVGISSGAAWVIDGATGFGMCPLTSYPTDAAWYASELGSALATLSAETTVPADLLKAAIKQVARRFEAIARRPAPEDEPHAAVVTIRMSDDGQIQYAVLGDCAVIVPTPDGARLINDPVVGRFDGRFAQAIAALHGQGIVDKEDVQAKMIPVLRDLRKTMNRPEGYWVAALDPDVASHAVVGTVTLRPGESILLASDGFLRLIDPFGIYDAAALLTAAAADGLAPLIVDLRRRERQDREARRFPRLKVHDDATAMLLTLVD